MLFIIKFRVYGIVKWSFFGIIFSIGSNGCSGDFLNDVVKIKGKCIYVFRYIKLYN